MRKSRRRPPPSDADPRSAARRSGREFRSGDQPQQRKGICQRPATSRTIELETPRLRRPATSSLHCDIEDCVDVRNLVGIPLMPLTCGSIASSVPLASMALLSAHAENSAHTPCGTSSHQRCRQSRSHARTGSCRRALGTRVRARVSRLRLKAHLGRGGRRVRGHTRYRGVDEHVVASSYDGLRRRTG